MFYLTTHSTHFIYSMVKDHSDSERGNPCRHMGYSFQLTARVLLYAPSHRQDSTYHSLCYTSRGALAGTTTTVLHPAALVLDITIFTFTRVMKSLNTYFTSSLTPSGMSVDLGSTPVSEQQAMFYINTSPKSISLIIQMC